MPAIFELIKPRDAGAKDYIGHESALEGMAKEIEGYRTIHSRLSDGRDEGMLQNIFRNRVLA